MKKLTRLEAKVYNFIKNETSVEFMEMVDIEDLERGVHEKAKVLRGVISSLVKKDLIEVEEYDSNLNVQHFYWLKGAFDE